MMLPRKIMMVGLVLVVAACSRDRDITLTRFKNTGNGPDEFAIAPGKPLEAPESYSALPTPQPGAGNRTDHNTKADGIAALGGNPAATADTGVAPGDAGLVRHAGRHRTGQQDPQPQVVVGDVDRHDLLQRPPQGAQRPAGDQRDLLGAHRLAQLELGDRGRAGLVGLAEVHHERSARVADGWGRSDLLRDVQVAEGDVVQHTWGKARGSTQ